MEFICHFGFPVQIKSDRGKHFDCEMFRNVFLLLDTEHKMSTAFHPRGNSRVECGKGHGKLLLDVQGVGEEFTPSDTGLPVHSA